MPNLQLCRKPGQRINLYLAGRKIQLDVVAIRQRGQVVQLGISAPPECQIWREEIDPTEARSEAMEALPVRQEAGAGIGQPGC